MSSESLYQRRREVLRGRGVGIVEAATPSTGVLFALGEVMVDPSLSDDVRRRLPAHFVPAEAHRATDAAIAPRCFRSEQAGETETYDRVCALREEHGPAVTLHHLFSLEPSYAGGPFGLPQPVAPGLLASVAGPLARPGRVGLLDSGVRRDSEGMALMGNLALAPDADADPTDADGDGLCDIDAGHGTFIAGILSRRAPGVSLVARRVLDARGLVDELALAAAIRAMGSASLDVLNLSLGGYTMDNQEPAQLTAALRSLPPRTVVVAAAGNGMTPDRPFWPAASKLPQVVAVGSLQATGGAPSGFTNSGSWVDACARGEGLVSSFLEFDGILQADPTKQPNDFDGAAQWSGTSFAAPTVAGAILAEMSTRGVPALTAANELMARGRAVPGLGHEVS
ncbi:MAG: S8 family serine peptidase [Acidimicrobiales bacterium]